MSTDSIDGPGGTRNITRRPVWALGGSADSLERNITHRLSESGAGHPGAVQDEDQTFIEALLQRSGGFDSIPVDGDPEDALIGRDILSGGSGLPGMDVFDVNGTGSPTTLGSDVQIEPPRVPGESYPAPIDGPGGLIFPLPPDLPGEFYPVPGLETGGSVEILPPADDVPGLLGESNPPDDGGLGEILPSPRGEGGLVVNANEDAEEEEGEVDEDDDDEVLGERDIHPALRVAERTEVWTREEIQEDPDETFVQEDGRDVAIKDNGNGTFSAYVYKTEYGEAGPTYIPVTLINEMTPQEIHRKVESGYWNSER